MSIAKGLLYTEEHEWVKVEGNEAYIGISDFAQHALGDIVFVELPDTGTEINKGETFAAVESVKAASDVFMPVSGKVLEVNEELVDNPALINMDAFENWMIHVELSDKSQLDQLLNAEQYETYCSEVE